jgi:hypothetical protein
MESLSGKLASLRVLALLPLIVLAIDFFRAPFLFNTESSAAIPKLEQLLPRKTSFLGRFRGHEFTVSVGTLGDAGYLTGLVDASGGRIGLVMSHFIVRKDFISNVGPVGRAVHSLLLSASEEVAGSFLDVLRAAAEHTAGDVISFRVGDRGRNELSQSPIDVIYIVLLNAQDSKSNYINNISTGLAKTMKLASVESPSGLLVTTLGIGPRYRPADPANFYSLLLDSVEMGTTPGIIYVGFYANWPTSYMKENIDDLNATWSNATSGPFASRLHRAYFRFAFICLTVCLLVSSMFVPLNIKNGLLVSIAYLGSVLGADTLLTFLLSGFGPDFLLFGSLAFQAILAFFFPYIARLNPKNVFGGNSRS